MLYIKTLLTFHPFYMYFLINDFLIKKRVFGSPKHKKFGEALGRTFNLRMEAYPSVKATHLRNTTPLGLHTKYLTNHLTNHLTCYRSHRDRLVKSSS